MTAERVPARVRLAHEAPVARRHHLTRARDVARRLIEILELEDEPLAEQARDLRRQIDMAIRETGR